MDNNTLEKKLTWYTNYALQYKSGVLPSSLSPFLRNKLLQAMNELKALLSNTLSSYEKVILLYRCISLECAYDYSYKRSSFDFLPPLTDHIGTCSGFAKLMTIMLPHIADCSVYLVNGYCYKNPQDIPEDNRGHAWNIVQFPDGKAYHLDVTWDLHKDDKPASTKWLLCSDDEMPRCWSRRHYPVAAEAFQGDRTCDEQLLLRLRERFRGLAYRLRNGTYNLTPLNGESTAMKDIVSNMHIYATNQPYW